MHRFGNGIPEAGTAVEACITSDNQYLMSGACVGGGALPTRPQSTWLGCKMCRRPRALIAAQPWERCSSDQPASRSTGLAGVLAASCSEAKGRPLPAALSWRLTGTGLSATHHLGCLPQPPRSPSLPPSLDPPSLDLPWALRV
jgi:hypothetical protein